LTDRNQYSNYGLGDERVRDVFGENYERLQKLKEKYDPEMVFHKWYPIIPKA
jgi:FAD/FMN-containing dehydrogenase